MNEYYGSQVTSYEIFVVFYEKYGWYKDHFDVISKKCDFFEGS